MAEVDVLRDRLALLVNLEDLQTALHVRAVDRDLAVEASGTQQRRVEDVGRFVAAMRITPPFTSKPSISTSSWFSVCSRSS